jgi:hypothetical protein
MAFRFSNIITILSRRFSKKNLPDDTQTMKKKKKLTTKATTDDVEEPLSLSSSSSRHTNTMDDLENNAIVLAGKAAAAVPTQELPYAQYVTLTPEEKKFHCQIRVMAHEVKYSMVTTVINSWEQDLKIIPDWDKIGGELLLRKYVEIVEEHVYMVMHRYSFAHILSPFSASL